MNVFMHNKFLQSVKVYNFLSITVVDILMAGEGGTNGILNDCIFKTEL